MPMHAVYKASSTTTKIRAVFDASAKWSITKRYASPYSDHASSIDVLLRFRLYYVALTADVSKMYQVIELTSADCFVWKSSPNEPMKDYHKKRVTFGVSASSFAANMALKQNAYSHKYPMAAEAVQKSFYVSDCLTGASNPKLALMMQQQLTDLFSRGTFMPRKWNSNDPSVLRSIPEDLSDSREIQTISETDEYTKTLGIEWNMSTDQFRLTITELPPSNEATKRVISDVARVFDVLVWFSPVTIKMKILLQCLWEIKDGPVPKHILLNYHNTLSGGKDLTRSLNVARTAKCVL